MHALTSRILLRPWLSFKPLLRLKTLLLETLWLSALSLLLVTALVAAANAQTPATIDNDNPVADESTVTLRPAILYNYVSQKNDRAFNQAAFDGATRASKQLGIKFEEYRISENDDREAFIRKVAESGVTHIIALGFQNVVPVLKLAEQYPDVKFTVIDGIVPPVFTNVQSIIFKDHEGAFLVGMIAAYKSKSGKVGFIGGMDVPLIRNFAYGFEQGVQFANPKVKVLVDMIGTTQEAWSNQVKGAALAEKQFDQGVDVVFAAAGGSGLGVLHSARQHNKLAIGVDTNQNSLYPGTVLTSMVKRVDNAVYGVLENSQQGKWEAGIKYLGMKENALDYAVDRFNRDLITKDIIDRVETAKELIIRGQLVVNVYSPN
jgi:basic membrane protein A